MGLSLFVIAVCLIFGAIAATLPFWQDVATDLSESLRQKEGVKNFSPRKTLFIIGPSANHAACRLQRRLLKPAIPALISEDITVIELYGTDTPRKNGEPIEWLDPDLLRHAMAADEGFFIIYVDDSGKTKFRSEAPMLTADLISRAGIHIEPAAAAATAARNSKVLKKLKAA